MFLEGLEKNKRKRGGDTAPDFKSFRPPSTMNENFKMR